MTRKLQGGFPRVLKHFTGFQVSLKGGEDGFEVFQYVSGEFHGVSEKFSLFICRQSIASGRFRRFQGVQRRLGLKSF